MADPKENPNEIVKVFVAVRFYRRDERWPDSGNFTMAVGPEDDPLLAAQKAAGVAAKEALRS